MSEPTFRDLQRCCEREVSKRKHVYPRLIQNEKMTAQKAALEIGLMAAAAQHFKELAEGQEAIERLI